MLGDTVMNPQYTLAYMTKSRESAPADLSTGHLLE